MLYSPRPPSATTITQRGKRKRVRVKTKFRLSPVLIQALAELAAAESLPLATLVTVLLNEGLTHRVHRRSHTL